MLATLLACAVTDCPEGFERLDDGNCYPFASEPDEPDPEPEREVVFEYDDPPTAAEIEAAFERIASDGLPTPNHVWDRQRAWFRSGDSSCPGGEWDWWWNLGCTSDDGVYIGGKNLVIKGGNDPDFYYAMVTAAWAEAPDGTGLWTGGGFDLSVDYEGDSYTLVGGVSGDFIESPADDHPWMGGSGQAVFYTSDGETLSVDGGVGHPDAALYFDDVVATPDGCLSGDAAIKIDPLNPNAPWVDLELGCPCGDSDVGEVCSEALGQAVLDAWDEMLEKPRGLGN